MNQKLGFKKLNPGAETEFENKKRPLKRDHLFQRNFHLNQERDHVFLIHLEGHLNQISIFKENISFQGGAGK